MKMIDLVESNKILSLINKALRNNKVSEEIKEYLWSFRHDIWAVEPYYDYGIWFEERTDLKCSLCGWKINDEIKWFINDLPGNVPKYCPNCGSRMFCENTDVREILATMFGVNDN